FDWPLKNNLMPVNLRAEFVLDAVHNILSGNGSKCLACFPGFQRKHEARFTDSARQFFCLVQFAGFPLCTLLLQRIELTQCARSDFVCFPAWQEIIARITTTHLDYVR